MDCTSNFAPPANGILATAVSHAADNEFAALVALRMLKRKHRDRPDVLEKLVELAERRQEVGR